MSLLTEVRRQLSRAGDKERAGEMRAYMKSAMPFHGVPSEPRKRICKEIFAATPLPDASTWERLVLELWRGAKFREERYAALQLAEDRRSRPFLTVKTLAIYDEMIVSGAWWDYVDDLAGHKVGALLREFPAPIAKAMRKWSKDADLWRRRTSILCQLGFKTETDLELMFECIEPSLGSREFFLQKAIGWALRQYAWSDPKTVIRYVRQHRDRLAPLSKREALKNCLKNGLITAVP